MIRATEAPAGVTVLEWSIPQIFPLFGCKESSNRLQFHAVVLRSSRLVVDGIMLSAVVLDSQWILVDVCSDHVWIFFNKLNGLVVLVARFAPELQHGLRSGRVGGAQ